VRSAARASFLVCLLFAARTLVADPAGSNVADDTENAAYEAMQSVFSEPQVSRGPEHCQISSTVDYNKFLLAMPKFRDAWLYADNSVEFYQRRGHQILTIVARKQATLVTQAFFGVKVNEAPLSCRFEFLVTDQDKYGNPKPYLLLSWRFTRALAKKVNWKSLDDKQFLQLAIDFKYSPKLLELAQEEYGASAALNAPESGSNERQPGPSSSQNSEWVSLGKSDDGKHWFVDASSIRVTGEIRRAWVKVVLRPRTVSEPGKHGIQWVNHTVAEKAFNCTQGTARMEALIFYFENGEPFDSSKGLPSSWAPIPPDTVGSDEFQFVCTWKPK
jgi:hypothetical protein